jgi:DnaJ-domain-containing protein 1
MYDSDDKVSKWKIEVELELDNGTRLLGSLFIKPMQRISDLLNDQRQFLPLQTSDGLIVQLQKAAIAKVVQLNQNVERDSISDPYEILGVAQSVSNEALKETYHSLCSAYHPDKLLSLGMSTEFIDLANSRIIRIIDAYRRILIERRIMGKDSRNSDSTADPVL